MFFTCGLTLSVKKATIPLAKIEITLQREKKNSPTQIFAEVLWNILAKSQQKKVRGIFTQVSKVICSDFVFALLLSDWSKKFTPLSQPIRSKTKTIVTCLCKFSRTLCNCFKF